MTYTQGFKLTSVTGHLSAIVRSFCRIRGQMSDWSMKNAVNVRSFHDCSGHSSKHISIKQIACLIKLGNLCLNWLRKIWQIDLWIEKEGDVRKQASRASPSDRHHLDLPWMHSIFSISIAVRGESYAAELQTCTPVTIDDQGINNYFA